MYNVLHCRSFAAINVTSSRNTTLCSCPQSQSAQEVISELAESRLAQGCPILQVQRKHQATRSKLRVMMTFLKLCKHTLC